MARGLPCIGSRVGGIPELLPAEDLVAPGDIGGLAARIAEVLASAPRRTEMSARNLARAADYRPEILHQHMLAFHRFVRERTLMSFSRDPKGSAQALPFGSRLNRSSCMSPPSRNR